MMLRAIGDGRRRRVAACAHWASTPAGRLLQTYEEEWARFRDADITQRRKGCIGVPAVLGRVTQRKGAEVATDRALFVELRKVHAQLKRIVDVRRQLEHFNDLRDRLGPKAMSPRQAARAAMEEDRAHAAAQLQPWLKDGHCPCAPHESCGRSCPNYVSGAQAAWCASRARPLPRSFRRPT